MYEKYGICAYNLGTEQQPLLGSCYWLEEAYRLHPDTLTTVVLEVQELTSVSYDAFYRKALDPMRFSSVKYRAVKEYTARDEAETKDVISCLFPILSYHERWKELTEEDFLKAFSEPESYLRGYDYVTTREIEVVREYDDVLPFTGELDPEVGETELVEESLYYFAKMTEFCEEHGLQLVLVKTPTDTWTSADHNAVQMLADSYGLDYYDFCFSPYADDIEFSIALDIIDNHMNYYGARKLTAYMGNCLVEYYGNQDVRGKDGYEFLEEELTAYKRRIISASLREETDPAEYLSALMNEEGFSILITVCDEAANSLTEEQREIFASLGLTQLSVLAPQSSYIAVIENGIVEKEMAGMENLTLSGTLVDGSTYSLNSAGFNAGLYSSCMLNGEEYSECGRGLNITVYDNQRQEIVDTTYFDTFEASERAPADLELRYAEDMAAGKAFEELDEDEQKLYLYEQSCETQ